LLKEIVNSKKTNRMKECHLRIIGVLKLKLDRSPYVSYLKKTDGDTIVDPVKVERTIAAYYHELYAAGSTTKVTREVGDIRAITEQELKIAAEVISLNKAVSYGMIPDTILKDMNEKLRSTLTKLLYAFFATNRIPPRIAALK